MTVRLTLVRHGRAAAGFDQHLDPGLHPDGQTQAQAVADVLAPLGPQPVVVSPLRRARETAAPLAARWSVVPRIEPRVGEIPSPTDDVAERGRWLRALASHRWTDVDPALQCWRDDVVGALLELDRDAVVVSHFIAIAAVVGVATGRDDIVAASPGYCSRTVVEHDGARLHLVELGVEAVTEVR